VEKEELIPHQRNTMWENQLNVLTADDASRIVVPAHQQNVESSSLR
jgi:hypothetical protein